MKVGNAVGNSVGAEVQRPQVFLHFSMTTAGGSIPGKALEQSYPLHEPHRRPFFESRQLTSSSQASNEGGSVGLFAWLSSAARSVRDWGTTRGGPPRSELMLDLVANQNRVSALDGTKWEETEGRSPGVGLLPLELLEAICCRLWIRCVLSSAALDSWRTNRLRRSRNSFALHTPRLDTTARCCQQSVRWSAKGQRIERRMERVAHQSSL